MTPIEAIKPLFPGENDETLSNIIWNCSAFPFDCWANCYKQLSDLAQRSGGDAQKAMDIANAEIEEAMKSCPTE